MGSLSDLNTYSNQTLTYTDAREPNVILMPPDVADYSATVSGYTLDLYVASEVIEIIRPTLAALKLIIDVSAVSGSTVTWSGGLPSGVTSVESPTGVYTVSGIDSVDDWAAVTAATINVPTTFNGSYIYDVTIQYVNLNGIQNVTYEVGQYVPVVYFQTEFTQTVTPTYLYLMPSLTLVSSTSISCELTLNYYFNAPSSSFSFVTPDESVKIAAPTMLTTDAGTYTVTVTPSNTSQVDTITTAHGDTSGFSFNPTTKVATLTGSYSLVDAYLQNLYITGATASDTDFTMTFEGTADNTVPDASITIDMLTTRFLSSWTPQTVVYNNTETTTNIDNLPTIVDLDYTDQGVYTYTVTPTVPANIDSFSTTGATGWQQYQRYSDLGAGDAEFGGDEKGGVWFGDANSLVINDHGNDLDGITNRGQVLWFTKVNGEWQFTQRVLGAASSDSTGFHTIAMAEDNTTAIMSDIGSEIIIYEYYDGGWFQSQNIPVTSARDVMLSRSGDIMMATTDGGASDNILVWTRSGLGDYSLADSIGNSNRFSTVMSGDGSLVVTGIDATNILTIRNFDGSNLNFEQNLSIDVDNNDVISINNAGTAIVLGYGPGDAQEGVVKIITKSGATWSAATLVDLSSVGAIIDMKFNTSDNLLLVTTEDNDVRIYDYDDSAHTVSLQETLSTPFTDIADLAIDDDSNQIVVAGQGIDGSGSLSGFRAYEFTTTSDFNATSKVLTLTGNKTNINSQIATITLDQATSDDIELTVEMTNPNGVTESRTLLVLSETEKVYFGAADLSASFGLSAELYTYNEPNPGRLLLALPFNANTAYRDISHIAGTANTRSRPRIEPTGGVSISSSTSKFYGSSYTATSGTGSKLQYTLETSFTPHLDDWTIEFWYYTTNTSTNNWILSNNDMGGSLLFGIYFDDPSVYPISIDLGEDRLPEDNTSADWHHIAITPDYYFIDGTRKGSVTVPTLSQSINTIHIGQQNATDTNDFIGSIQDFRFYIDLKKYTATTYTVPTQIME